MHRRDDCWLIGNVPRATRHAADGGVAWSRRPRLRGRPGAPGSGPTLAAVEPA